MSLKVNVLASKPALSPVFHGFMAPPPVTTLRNGSYIRLLPLPLIQSTPKPSKGHYLLWQTVLMLMVGFTCFLKLNFSFLSETILGMLTHCSSDRSPPKQKALQAQVLRHGFLRPRRSQTLTDFFAYKESSQMNHLYTANFKWFFSCCRRGYLSYFSTCVSGWKFLFFSNCHEKDSLFFAHKLLHFAVKVNIYCTFFLHFLMEHVCDYWINMNVLSFATLLLQ